MDSLHSEANLQGTWICQLTSSRAVTDDQQMYLKWTSGDLPCRTCRSSVSKKVTRIEPDWLLKCHCDALMATQKSTDRTINRNFRLIAGWLLGGPEWNGEMKRTQSWAEIKGLHHPCLQKSRDDMLLSMLHFHGPSTYCHGIARIVQHKNVQQITLLQPAKLPIRSWLMRDQLLDRCFFFFSVEQKVFQCQIWKRLWRLGIWHQFCPMGINTKALFGPVHRCNCMGDVWGL